MSSSHAPTLVEANDSQSSETRLTLRLSPSARAELEWIAGQLDTSLTDAVKRSIGLQKLLLELRQSNAKVMVEQPGQTRKEIIIV